MEEIFIKNKKILLVIIIVLSSFLVSSISMAKTKLYTEGLKKGDELSFTKNGATTWCVYKNKADAKKTGIKLAVNYIKPKDKITILGVATDCNVLKVKVENTQKNYTGFIHYGSTASKYFEKVTKQIAVKKVKLDSTKPINMKVGDKVQVKATISPANATYKSLEVFYWNTEWNYLKTSEASKTEIMNVKEQKVNNGEYTITITAKKEGKATLFVRTINDKGVTAEVKREITITKPLIEVKNVLVNTSSVKLPIGQTETIKATVVPSNATNKTVTWKSSNEKIAKVNSKGKVTAVSEGSAVITATVKGTKKSAKCKVTVIPVKPIVASVTFKDKTRKTSGKLEVNKTMELVAEVHESTGEAKNKQVGYTVNNTDIVDLKVENGKVYITGKKAGQTTIVARAMADETKKAEYKITVTEPAVIKPVVNSITFKDKEGRTSGKLEVNKTMELVAEVNESTGEAKNKQVGYTVNNTDIVDLKVENGKVYITGKKAGQTTIVARAMADETKKTEYRITVTNPTKRVPGKGAYVKFEGNQEKWIVLYKEGEIINNKIVFGTQLVSANTLGRGLCYLGYEDNMVNWNDKNVIKEANIYEDTRKGDSNVLSGLEKNIYSYNHLIRSLNDECNEIVEKLKIKGIKSIRCIGSNPTSKNAQPSVKYSSTQLKEYPKNHLYFKSGIFDSLCVYGDGHYKFDYERLKELKQLKAENGFQYWLASRGITYNSRNVYFSARRVNYNGELGLDTLLQIKEDNVASYSNTGVGVRPVITVDTNVLSNITAGSGTMQDPFIIK